MITRPRRKIVGYNVYHAPEGSAPSFHGFVTSLWAARHLAATGIALEASLFDTARAAGHCAGLTAPTGDEAEEPAAWFGRWDCAVPVYSAAD